MNTHRAYAVECLIFLLILIALMGFTPLGARPPALSFKTVAATIAVHDVALTALVVYLVWRRGEGPGALGWVSKSAWREAGLGLALFFPFILGLGLLAALLSAAGFPEPSGPPPYLLPRTDTDYLVAPLLLAVVAIAEETVFRGYLLLRFRQITGNRAAAVIASSVLFGLGHAYQGSLGVVAVAAVGVTFSAIYYWRGSLIAPMVMHFVQNCLGLLVAPKLLGG